VPVPKDARNRSAVISAFPHMEIIAVIDPRNTYTNGANQLLALETPKMEKSDGGVGAMLIF